MSAANADAMDGTTPPDHAMLAAIAMDLYDDLKSFGFNSEQAPVDRAGLVELMYRYFEDLGKAVQS